MPAAMVKVHEGLWAPAPSSRREEWRLLCSELASHGGLLPDHEAELVVVWCDAEHVEVRISATRETEFGPAPDLRVLRAPRQELDPVLTEYLDVIRRLDDDGISSARAEALDMAKKVVHDDAARRVAALFPELAQEHEVRRRFFSLFVALAYDTSHLGRAHRHP
jgi:hypothetical protein